MKSSDYARAMWAQRGDAERKQPERAGGSGDRGSRSSDRHADGASAAASERGGGGRTLRCPSFSGYWDRRIGRRSRALARRRRGRRGRGDLLPSPRKVVLGGAFVGAIHQLKAEVARLWA